MNNYIITKIVSLLISSDHKEQAMLLENEIGKLNNTDLNIRMKAAESIIQMCHIKWLGDLYVKGISGDEWLSCLDGLKKEVRKVLKNIK